jgi:serine/threonine protein kinase
MVYSALYQVLSRPAAVKVLRPELCADAAMLGRFFHEARAASLVRHPGIVDVLDVGQQPDGSAFIVMELLEGETLAASIRRQGRVPPPIAAEIAWQLASALGAVVAAHQDRDAAGHAGLHVARAAARHQHRPSHRCLRAGVHPLRDGDGAGRHSWVPASASTRARWAFRRS